MRRYPFVLRKVSADSYDRPEWVPFPSIWEPSQLETTQEARKQLQAFKYFRTTLVKEKHPLFVIKKMVVESTVRIMTAFTPF